MDSTFFNFNCKLRDDINDFKLKLADLTAKFERYTDLWRQRKEILEYGQAQINQSSDPLLIQHPDTLVLLLIKLDEELRELLLQLLDGARSLETPFESAARKLSKIASSWKPVDLTATPQKLTSIDGASLVELAQAACATSVSYALMIKAAFSNLECGSTGLLSDDVDTIAKILSEAASAPKLMEFQEAWSYIKRLKNAT